MTKPKYILEIFEGRTYGADRDSDWHWRLRSRRNKMIVAIGGEPFATKHTARTSFEKLGIPEESYVIEYIPLS